MAEQFTGSTLKGVAARFRRRLMSGLVAVGIARLTLAAVLLFVVGASVDWVFHIPWGWRVLPLAIFISALSWLAYYSIRRPLAEHWSDKEILAWLDRYEATPSLLLDRYELLEAEGIEERHDPQGQRLLDQAIAGLSADPNSAEMIKRSFRGAAAKRWWLAAAFAVGMVAVAAVVLPVHTRAAATRFFNPFSAARWPHRTNIALAEPEGGWNIPQGEALAVRAEISGIEIPREVDLFYRLVAKGNWVREHLAVGDDNRAEYRFPEIREPLEFYLSGGDDTTDRFHVRIIRSPSLEKIVVHLESPSYSGVPSRTKEGGDVEGLEGSRARIEFTSSTPLKSALLTFDGEKEQSLAVAADRTFAAEFMLTKSTAYTVKLIGESGFREPRPERYEIRVRPDAPPEAEIVAPERETEGTAGAAYKVRFNASDDFELAKVEFLYRLDNGPLLALSDRVTGPVAVHCKKTTGAFNWNLTQLGIPAKDMVTLEYFLRATDTNPTGRGVTESPHHRIRVLKPSLYRESLLVRAKALVNETLLAERNQRQSYEAGKKFLAGGGSGAEDDPTWRDVTTLQTGSINAAQAMSAQLSLLLEDASANRIQTEFMTARLSQIAEVLGGVMENQHVAIARQLDEARPRDAAQSTPAVLLARRAAALRPVNETEAGQKRAALELQRLLFLVFDWSDLQSAAVSALRLHEQQDDCGRETAAIAPTFIGKDIRDLSDSDQEKLIVLGKAQRVIYDAESVLEGHLEQILTKAERQKRQSIRVPIYFAYSELRNRRVKDRLLVASEAIKNNQPADILNEQKTALDALRIVKAGLEAAGAPEKLAALPLATEIVDIDAEDSKQKPNVDETGPPPPRLIASDRQGADPLTTSILSAGDAVRDLVRRSEYLAGRDASGDLPRFQRLRFGRLAELGGQADQNLKQAMETAEKEKAAFVQTFLMGLKEDLAGTVRLIEERNISPAARQIAADAALGTNDVVEMLAATQAVKQMKEEHDRQGGIDPFKRPYELQGADLAAAADAIDRLLELRLELQECGRVLHRLGSQQRNVDGSFSSLITARRMRLARKQQELAGQFATLKENIGAISETSRAKVTAQFGDLLGHDITSSLAAPAGGEADAAARTTRDAGKIAQIVQGLRDLMDARGLLAPTVVADAAPSPQVIAQMSEAEYAKTMSLPALKQRVAGMTGLPPALRDSLVASLSHEFPPESERFLAAYVNAILSAAKEKDEKQP